LSVLKIFCQQDPATLLSTKKGLVIELLSAGILTLFTDPGGAPREVPFHRRFVDFVVADLIPEELLKELDKTSPRLVRPRTCPAGYLVIERKSYVLHRENNTRSAFPRQASGRPLWEKIHS
jgi:hypothetical protein